MELKKHLAIMATEKNDILNRLKRLMKPKKLDSFDQDEDYTDLKTVPFASINQYLPSFYQRDAGILFKTQFNSNGIQSQESTHSIPPLS